jgi:hypothetical protein
MLTAYTHRWRQESIEWSNQTKVDIAYGTHTDWTRKKIDMEEGEVEEEDSWEEMHSLRGSNTLGASKREMRW